MTLSIDGHTTSITSSASSATIGPLTTTLVNDVIVLVSYCENAAGPSITSITGGGLAFTKRTSSHGSSRGYAEIWWAPASSIVSAVTFTITYSSAFDDQSAVIFAVNGCNITSPWDANSSVPAKVSYSTTTTPAFTSISTTNAPGLELFVVGTNTASTMTAASGFTRLATSNNGGGAQYSYMSVDYQAISSNASSVTYTGGSTVAGTSIETIFDSLAAGLNPIALLGQLTTSGIGVLVPTAISTATTFNSFAIPGGFIDETGSNQYAIPGAYIDETSAVNASLTLTGVSSTSGIGTPTIGLSGSVSITGQQTTSAIGSLTVSLSQNLTLTGQQTTSHIGTLTLTDSGNLSITGQQTTSAIGTPTIGLSTSVTLTGQSATSQIGSLTTQIIATVAITGQQSSAQVGTPLVSVIAQPSLTGQSTTSAIGSLTVTNSSNLTLTGQHATTSVGQLAKTISQTLSGVVSTTGLGTVTAYPAFFAGVQATGQIGSLTDTIVAIPIVGLSLGGEQANSQIGSLTVKSGVNTVNTAINGQTATAHVGTLRVPNNAAISGVSATAQFSGPEAAVFKYGMKMTGLKITQIPQDIKDFDVTMRWSDTDGHSWVDSSLKTLGLTGNYLTNVQWRRLGMSRRGRVFELSWSVAAPIALQSATIRLEDAST